jgi:glycosyltransferase involved in cell wall biosynthesis
VVPRLVVAGDGPLQNQFAERARHLDGLEVLGFVDATQRARCMERASVVLLPSRRDPWPLAACEALVARRPLVLGTGVGSRPDLETLVGDGVVPMRSPDVDGLLAASRAARTCHVPDGMRAAFTPQSSAEAMVAAVAEAAHQRPASNPHG